MACLMLALIVYPGVVGHAVEEADQTIDLQYNFVPGEIQNYRATVFLDMKIDGTPSLHNVMELEMIYSQEVLEEKDDTYILLITIEEYSIAKAETFFGRVSGSDRKMDMKRRLEAMFQPLLEDGYYRLTVDSWGHILEEEVSEAVEDLLQDEMGIDLVQQFIIPLPREKIQEGHTWEDTTTLILSEFDVELSMPVKYSMDRVRYIRGDVHASLKAIQKGEEEMELEEKTGTFVYDFSREYLFNVDKGFLVSLSEEQFFSYNIFDESGDKVHGIESEGTLQIETIND